MNDITKILRQAHAELWAFRDEMGEAWPTPDTLDALRFAVTEAGEALDAWMRANRPQYARNRERLDYDEAVLDELVDCAMMLLTAIPPFVAVDPKKWPAEAAKRLDEIVYDVSEMLWLFVAYGSKPYARNWDAFSLVRAIATYPGMDLLPRLQSRYARIRAKQRPRVRLMEVDGQIGGFDPSRFCTAPNALQPDDEPQGWGTDTL